jgi:hypothetical protein
MALADLQDIRRAAHANPRGGSGMPPRGSYTSSWTHTEHRGRRTLPASLAMAPKV